MSHFATLREAYPFVDELGSLPSIVAGNLLAQGHKGKRGKEDCCPLARYLTSRIGQPVLVTGELAIVGDNDYGHKIEWPLKGFVGNFDAHVYPFLEEQG